MARLRSVDQYLGNMKFRRTWGHGLDEENVLLHIQKICALYEAEREQLKAEFLETQLRLYGEAMPAGKAASGAAISEKAGVFAREDE